jgi:transketolase
LNAENKGAIILGDQIGLAVNRGLQYVPYSEFERILALPLNALQKTELFAALCRINTLYMIARAGSGHIGSSFSSMEIMTWLQLNELRTATPDDPGGPNDIFFSSKGHDAPALYNIWLGLGKLNFNFIHELRRLNGLPGHPDISTPNVITNTGSLGMGVSKAKGMILANRVMGKTEKVYVLTGDGELQEGQFWESLLSAANEKLSELTVIIDHNKLQSDTFVSKISDLGDLKAKLLAFGWHVSRCDGNDLLDLSKTLTLIRAINDQPKVIIADTIKGRGVSFMEHTSMDSDLELYRFHSGAPTEDVYVRAVRELIDAANTKLVAFKANPIKLREITHSVVAQQDNPQRLIQAYSSALLERASKNHQIVALDADLAVDTGLIPFKEKFPARFFECGIAEQDMVSQAGGMALKGLLPVVHSFASFLSTRPNEQIYNNATEKTKIIYVGSLAGILPGGPGHSHQSVRDISALAAVPGLMIVEPSCEEEVGQLLDWCINKHEHSSYIRLVSVPYSIPFALPKGYVPKKGQGVSLTEGSDAVIIGYGPIMLTASIAASEILGEKMQLSVKVINLPWLNYLDTEWFMREINGIKKIFSLDNHFRIGGQGDRLAECLAERRIPQVTLHRIALEQLPASGSNSEVITHHRLDANSIASIISEVVG